jgi:hypothetical protein
VSEDADLYDLARNEFLAVDIVLPVIETDDDQGQYCLHTGQHRFEPNMPYQEYSQQRAVGSMLRIIGERSKTAMRRELTVHGICSPLTVFFAIATL